VLPPSVRIHGIEASDFENVLESSAPNAVYAVFNIPEVCRKIKVIFAFSLPHLQNHAKTFSVFAEFSLLLFSWRFFAYDPFYIPFFWKIPLSFSRNALHSGIV